MVSNYSLHHPNQNLHLEKFLNQNLRPDPDLQRLLGLQLSKQTKMYFCT